MQQYDFALPLAPFSIIQTTGFNWLTDIFLIFTCNIREADINKCKDERCVLVLDLN